MSNPLTEFAYETMGECEGNIDLAVKVMVERLQNDQVLFEECALPILMAACKQRCQEVWRKSRAARGSAPGHSSDLLAGYRAAMRQDMDSLLDFELPNGQGLILRHATRPMLADAVGRYYKQARTMMVRREWLAMIMKKMPDDKKTVEQVCSEKHLRRWMEKAESSVA